MATIAYADILKRDNVKNFVNRVSNKGSFNEKTENGAVLTCTGKIRAKQKGKMISLNLNEDEVRGFIDGKGSSDFIEVEVTKGGRKQYIRVSNFYKDKEFGGVAGKSTGGGSERQELGLIDLLNEAAKKGDKYYVSSLGRNHKIRAASKNEGLSPAGQEPYIDVFVETQDGKKLGVSCKGESAPSLAGGGIVGMKLTVPQLLDDLYNALQRYIGDELGHGEGAVIPADSIPDIFVPIPDKYVEKILVGNKKMGGPVDLMFIGPMDINGTINDKTGEVSINNGRGKFYTIDEYMRKIPTFYFRIRKRDLAPDGMMQITYSRKNKDGYPLLFMSQQGRNNFRLVVTNKAAATGKTLLI